MRRTPARVTQADLARAIRAAQQCGAGKVRVASDGTITIDPQPEKSRRAEEKDIAPEKEIIL